MFKKSSASVLIAALLLSACDKDKMLHFGAGAAVSGVAYTATGDTKAGWAAAAAAGAAKEVYDSTGRGNVEAADFAATVAGAAIWEAVDCIRVSCLSAR